MYHHHSQQQGLQPFSNGSRPHHPPPPNQHQNRSSSDMLSQGMGFQFPRPTQLPDELESALAIHGPRDMDHRLIDHMSRPNQHQNQCSDPGISQRGNYSSDNPSGHQQEMDWSSYQPPTQLFAGPPPSASQQSQQHKGPQQKAPSSHAGTSIPNWTAPVSDSPSPQARHPLGGRSSGGVDGKGLYTPESAGSILASFGLSNEDLEVLSHYPDDQLTPDTLPFILRDIQINKSGNQIVASTSSFSRTIHDMSLPPPHSLPLAPSHSPEVPSLLTVTQTAGKVIDYGHASRANDKSNTRETFKREQLSNERTVKMYPSPSVPKADKGGRQQSHLEHTESSKHGDRDYRRASSDRRKNNRSPGREFPPSSKSRNLDRDYRRDELKPNLTSETRSNASSRRSLSSSSGSKPHGSSKKLPTPTMISDFSSVAPKVYPHTCSLCHIQCDQEKDWVDHINTVNHTAACRDLRNKYPDWKPNLPRSLSGSPTPSPPHSKRKPLGRPYPSHPLHQPSTEHGHQLESHHAGSLRNSSREHRPEKRARESFGGPFHSAGKYPQNNSTKFSTDTSRRPSLSKANRNSKNSTLQPTKAVKSGTKPGTKSAKPPPAKKKKKVVSPASQDSSVADRLLYLTGIPKDASEQEVTDWVGSFGKINNVILMPCSEVESERDQGQKASVCMVRMEDAQSLANSANLSIRDQQITASIAKEHDAGQSLDANNSKPVPGPDKGAAEEDTGGEADVKTADQGMVLITGLPESMWSESDIAALIEPFGTPSDIIMATQIGKVLVSVLNMDIAQELVKVNTSNPMKINDCELKMIHLKKCIRLSTPVALYNLLMGSEDPLESAVGWSSLLVISNVPNTPSAHSEVQKLVRRFGTVIKTVVINSMVICEMATAAMALSVYKRFNKFPCIIQNNPLYFSRKPDPKANTQNKVISACIDSSEETPANGKGCQRDQEETAHTQESLLEGKEADVDGKDKMTKSTHEIEGEALVKTDVLPNAVCGPLAEPDCKVPPETNMGETVPLETDMGETVPLETDTRETVHLDTDMGETVLDTDMKETIHLDTDMGATAADKTDVDTSKSEKDKSPAGEETKPSSSDGKATSKEFVLPELRKVTQEMVNALLVECRTRVPSHPNNSAAPTNKEVKETGLEAAQGREAAQAQEAARKRTEEEVKKKKDKERVRDREKRERERRDRERRERERRERERRDRKRTYGQSVAGRLEGNKQRRDEQKKHSEAKTNKVEEEFDEFPFNMSDFVTVDEVGDVTDLPSAPSPTIPMETTKVGEDPVCGQMDTTMDTPMEVPTDSSVSLVKSDDICECVAVPTPALVLTAAASQSDSNHSPTHVPSCQPDAPEIGSTLKASPDFADEVEPVPTCTSVPADSGPVKVKAEREDIAVTQLPEGMEQAEENRQLVQEQGRETEAPAADTGKHDGSKEQTHTDEDSVSKAVKKEPTMSTDCPLPPYNPSNPVGMEFLIPKTGFFCKVCNRFFSGFKEGEINHCKTLKHYTNVQKYLQTTEMANMTTKADLS